MRETRAQRRKIYTHMLMLHACAAPTVRVCLAHGQARVASRVRSHASACHQVVRAARHKKELQAAAGRPRSPLLRFPTDIYSPRYPSAWGTCESIYRADISPPGSLGARLMYLESIPLQPLLNKDGSRM